MRPQGWRGAAAGGAAAGGAALLGAAECAQAAAVLRLLDSLGAAHEWSLCRELETQGAPGRQAAATVLLMAAAAHQANKKAHPLSAVPGGILSSPDGRRPGKTETGIEFLLSVQLSA